jgi:transposase-like protein
MNPTHCDRPMRRHGIRNGAQRWRCSICGHCTSSSGKGRGRPRLWDSQAERKRAERERKKGVEGNA